MQRVAWAVVAGAVAAVLAWWLGDGTAPAATPGGERCVLDLPVGPPDGTGYYVAQRFGENDHLGEDWNGVGGGDTDLGDPVHAIGAGVVTEVADHGGGWGLVVRVVHRCRVGDATRIESLYAHLDGAAVAIGDPVARGQRIGTIGTAHGRYPAHLHLELRDRPGLPLGAGYGADRRGYLDPSATIRP